jgi:hypothetical protein
MSPQPRRSKHNGGAPQKSAIILEFKRGSNPCEEVRDARRPAKLTQPGASRQAGNKLQCDLYKSGRSFFRFATFGASLIMMYVLYGFFSAKSW